MPPSFKATERKKPKESDEREKFKTLDEKVKDIVEKHRKEQKKRKRVDSWGQPSRKLDEGNVRRDLRKAMWEADGKAPSVKKEKGVLSKLADAAGRGPVDKPDSEPKKDSKAPREKEDSGKKNEPREPKEKKGARTPKEKKGDQKSKESSDRSKREAKHQPKEAKDPPKETKGRLGPKNNLRYGEVRGEKIKTPERLKELTDGEYEGLKSRKDFPKLKEDALAHMGMVKQFEGKERIPHGETSKMATALGRDHETVRQWTKGENAGLYKFMEWATPKSEASEKVRQILEGNNGVTSPADVRTRYDNYYFGEAERSARFHQREEAKMEKYFEFLERYKMGGAHLDIAKEVGLSDSGARAYLEGAKPWKVSVASQIPAEIPQEGHKWLPKVGGINAVRDDWVQVPQKVADWKQVKEVIAQFKPLDNSDMKNLAKKFEPWSKDESFMYLLGAYVSDSRVSSTSTSAIAFAINQKKDSSWSKNYGEACCYSLGKIGIKAHRVSNKEASVAKIETPYGTKEIRGGPQYEWMSENSPILRWMRKSCLGFDDSAKSYQEVEGQWILKSSEKLRASFLRGLSDGDGSASKVGYYFSVSTHSGHDFIGKLLNSFGASTYESKTYVRTDGFESVKRIAEIKPFRHATDRNADLQKAKTMIDARRHNIHASPPSKEEIQFMVSERSKGLSYGRIGESLFDEFGYTLDARDIRRVITKQKERQDSVTKSPKKKKEERED